MKKKTEVAKLKIGTYSNDGLGSGLPELDSSSEAFKEMKALIEGNKKQTREAYKEISLRLGNYITQKIGAYSNFESFDEWFWSNKVKFNQIGTKFPKIDDKVFIQAAQEYTAQLDKHIKSTKESKPRVNSISWSGNKSQLQLLFDKLIQEKFIDKNTIYNDFECLFSSPTKRPETPIVWAATIPDLICLFDHLNSEQLIDWKGFFPLIENLELLQSNKGTILKQNNLNVNKSNYEAGKGVGNMPKRHKEIEKIANKIKNIKTS